jgi:TolB-like protein
LTPRRQTDKHSAYLRDPGSRASGGIVRQQRLVQTLMICTALAVAAPALAESVRVAVLPVVVHSSESDSAYLSEGLSDTLAARLEQGGGIQIVQVDGAARATTKMKVALEAAKSVDAEYVVFGSFTQFGEGASLDLRAARVGAIDENGEPESRKVFIQSGTVSAIIPRLDDVAGRITQFIGTKGVAAGPPAGSVAESPAKNTGELERRIEALENAVFPKQASETSGGTPSSTE